MLGSPSFTPKFAGRQLTLVGKMTCGESARKMSSRMIGLLGVTSRCLFLKEWQVRRKPARFLLRA